MPTRIVDEQPRTTIVQRDGGGSVLGLTLLGLVVIAIVILVLLHFTVGVL